MDDRDRIDRNHQALTDAAAWQAGILFLLALALGIVTFWTQTVQQGHHKKEERAARATVNRNHFWKQLAGEEEIGRAKWSILARDIGPLLDPAFVETIPESGLLPKDLASIYVPDGQYGELHKTLGTYVLTGDPINTIGEAANDCVDCGYFDDGFLAKATVARRGEWKRFQEPIPVPDKSYTLTPGAVPGLLFYPLYAGAAMLIALVIAWWNFADDNSYRYDTPSFWEVTRPWPKEADGLNGWRATVALLAAPVGVPRLVLNVPFGLLRWVERLRDEEQARSEKPSNPVAVELAAAQTNLNRLLNLPYEHRQLAEVKKAIKDTETLVAELRKFPDEMSAKASKILARQIVATNKDLRDRPKAIDSAVDEVDGL